MALEQSHAERRLPTPEIQPSTCFNQDDQLEPLKSLEPHSPVGFESHYQHFKSTDYVFWHY